MKTARLGSHLFDCKTPTYRGPAPLGTNLPLDASATILFPFQYGKMSHHAQGFARSDKELAMPTTTSANETLESLQATLQPLADLQGQHTQLEAWVNDSCHALEKLHGELAEWQNELARKQTELDLREDALEKCQVQEEELGSQVEQWKADLATARQEAHHLEEENTDHLEQLEQLERRCIELESELKISQQRSDELATALDAERSRAAEEQTQWKEEFKGMRELLDKQCSLLATQLKPGEQPSRPTTAAVDSDAAARSQELRRRAQSRLAAKRRQQQEQQEHESEESDES